MSMSKQQAVRQYAVCPVGSDGAFVATELGVQLFLSVGDTRDPKEARARQSQVERAHGWPRSLLVDRGQV